MTKPNKDIWHNTKTALKIGDKINTKPQQNPTTTTRCPWKVNSP